VPRTGPPIPGGICVEPDGIRVRVDSISTGHSWPSGATQDRRTWLEVIAYDASDAVVFRSGVVPDGMDPEASGDPNLFGFWDRTLKTDNTQAHFFWDVAKIESVLLPGPTTIDVNDPAFDHSRFKKFFLTTAAIERVTARFRFRPLPFSMLDELIASGDLAASFRDQNKTLEVGSPRTWLKATREPSTFCGPPN
jgi:hypothetical protein